MKKVVLCIVMSVVMLCSTMVSAAQPQPSENGEVGLLYTNVGMITSSLTISNGVATCNGIVMMSKNYKSKITMTLQKSKDKSSYSKVTAWSQEYTGMGTKSMVKTRSLTKGYYYRVRVVVRVYSGSTVIEKIKKYSLVQHY